MEQELKRKDNHKEHKEKIEVKRDEFVESPSKPKLLNGTFDPIQLKQFFAKKILQFFQTPIFSNSQTRHNFLTEELDEIKMNLFNIKEEIELLSKNPNELKKTETVPVNEIPEVRESITKLKVSFTKTEPFSSLYTTFNPYSRKILDIKSPRKKTESKFDMDKILEKDNLEKKEIQEKKEIHVDKKEIQEKKESHVEKKEIPEKKEMTDKKENTEKKEKKQKKEKKDKLGKKDKKEKKEKNILMSSHKLPPVKFLNDTEKKNEEKEKPKHALKERRLSGEFNKEGAKLLTIEDSKPIVRTKSKKPQAITHNSLANYYTVNTKSNLVEDEIDVKKDTAKLDKGKKFKSRLNINDEEKKEKEKEKDDDKKSKKNLNIKKVITKKKIKEEQENKDNNNKNQLNDNSEVPFHQEEQQVNEEKPDPSKDENLDETFIVKKNINIENNLEIGDINENYYRDSLGSEPPRECVDSLRKTSQMRESILDESVSQVIEAFVNEVMTPKAKGHLKEEKVVPLITEAVIISERIPRNLIEEKIVIMEKPFTNKNQDDVDWDNQNGLIGEGIIE